MPKDKQPRSASTRALHTQLRRLAEKVHIEPQTNSVFSAARQLYATANATSLPIVSILREHVEELHYNVAEERARNLRAQHQAGEAEIGSWDELIACLNAYAEQGFESFRSAVSGPMGGIVFTAHPTFAHPASHRRAIAQLAVQNDTKSKTLLKRITKQDTLGWSRKISLYTEHAEAQEAIEKAKQALREYGSIVVEVARKKFPAQWESLRPSLPTVASWTGYDLDGRTDIHWTQSIALRLSEKATQLTSYCDSLSRAPFEGNEIADELREMLSRGADVARVEAEAFDCDPENIDQLNAAIETLTSPHFDRIVDLRPGMAHLQSMIDNSDLNDDCRAAAICLLAEMRNYQLGTGHIHLRVNAAQVSSAIKRDMNIELDDKTLGRRVLRDLAKKVASPEEKAPSFADLIKEQATARRQMMLCFQILTYIDAGAPIRFLIAETENPAIVMGALSLAREYGIEDSIDISPLFETPDALERGGRFVQRLLDEPEFLAYIERRGRLSIQLGFSDAGRFIGQLAADIAIERIHNLILTALQTSRSSVDLLLFNTHGESMGRGAWPGDFRKRFAHLLTPWVRKNAGAGQRNILHEVSFQGGDGYIHFANLALARSTCSKFVLSALSSLAPDKGDSFYRHTDFIWDFYRGLRRWHETLFDNANYQNLLTGFASHFLVKAGSRPRRRTNSGRSLRNIRAISHNATLQQLGVPMNTAGGVSTAADRELDDLAEIVNSSKRLRDLLELAVKARIKTSIPVLRAYGILYDPDLWVALGKYSSAEYRNSYQRVWETLQDGQSSQAVSRVANVFSLDLRRLDDLLAKLDDAPSVESRHEDRLDMHALHAIRIAALMTAFRLLGNIPPISERHQVDSSQIREMGVNGDIMGAIAMLETVFPLSEYPGLKQAELGYGYDEIHADIIVPLREVEAVLQHVSLSIGHVYGAYG